VTFSLSSALPVTLIKTFGWVCGWGRSRLPYPAAVMIAFIGTPPSAARPIIAVFQSVPRWRDHLLFYEYFHGDTGAGLGASHQTGWTGLVTKLLDQTAGPPQAEWVWRDMPELRIVPDDVWKRVQARRQNRTWTPGSHGGTHPKYLLSGLLKCGECGANYVLRQHRPGCQHYGCAVHYDRGPPGCRNGRLVQRGALEQKILTHVFSDLFAPHRLDYTERATAVALERMTHQSADTQAEREQALAAAPRELENTSSAIRQGILTPTTKAMLEDAERPVAALEQVVQDAKRRPAPVVSVRSVIERYLHDLNATLSTNMDEARRMLRLALDKIVLRQDGQHLVAEITGNYAGILNLGECVSSIGAGRGILSLPNWRSVRVVA